MEKFKLILGVALIGAALVSCTSEKGNTSGVSSIKDSYAKENVQEIIKQEQSETQEETNNEADIKGPVAGLPNPASKYCQRRCGGGRGCRCCRPTGHHRAKGRISARCRHGKFPNRYRHGGCGFARPVKRCWRR